MEKKKPSFKVSSNSNDSEADKTARQPADTVREEPSFKVNKSVTGVRTEETNRVIKSRTMLRFFTYENGEFKINKEEVFTLPSGKDMLQNDKGGMIKGDKDGRNKLFTEKRLGLVWWLIDINSPGIEQGLEGDELMRDGLKSLELPKDYDPKKDKYFMRFYEDYREMYNKASYAKLLNNMLVGFNDTSEIVKAVRNNVTKILKADKDLDADDVKMLLNSQREIMALAGDVPKHIDRLKELQQLVRKEEKNLTVARGGVIVSKSMVPNT